jgi:hypothetical protein
LAPEAERVAPSSEQLRLVNPQAGLGFDLEGLDGHQFAIPPAYSFSSEGEIGEIAENYWMALCRYISFAEYETDSLTQAAAADLSKYARFDGPKDGGKVTPKTLFRGFTEGDLVGPYLSQFMLWDIPYGAQKINRGIAYKLPENGGKDFLTDPNEWLAVQGGCMGQHVMISGIDDPQLIYRGFDLAQYVHIDELYQAYLNACLLLITPKSRGGMGAPIDEGNPYNGRVAATGQPKASNQAGFGTLGEPNFKTIVAEVATRALKAVWYQKWFVHRRLRPETFAGRVHFHVQNQKQYDLNAKELDKLKADVLPRVYKRNGLGGNASYLLPMSFPEGCPLHPAYGAGHATVAGACITMLKALFYEEATFTELGLPIKVPGKFGKTLDDYTGADKDKITIGGELNKLAANIGVARNFAGVHWRSDYTESIKLGERVALHFLQETAQTYNEDVSFSVTRVDGTKVMIRKQQF